MRNLLLVSYHFPPTGGSGVQRAVKLARYLPQSGWRVHILTAGHNHYPLLDPTLANNGSSGGVKASNDDDVIIHRVPGWEPGGIAASLCRWMPRRHDLSMSATRLEDRLYWRLDRWAHTLGLPELETLWVPSAVRAAGRIIRQSGIQAVVTTSPPHSTQRVGWMLSKRWGLPWIADLRDPILDNFAYRPVTRLANRYWRRLERTICTKAARVIVTCPELQEKLSERYPAADRSRYRTVTNGYDPADKPVDSVLKRRRSDRFILGYVGSFYRAQTIETILKAVRSLISHRRDLSGRIELRVVGSLSAQQRQFLCDSDDSFLKVKGYQSHAEAIREMAEADALFLMTPTNEGGRYCIPAKVYEYLAFGKHIIAMVHKGTLLEDVLKNAGNVTLIYQQDASDLSRTIESCFDAWATGNLDHPRSRNVVEAFSRHRLAQQFAGVIQECICKESLRDGTVEPVMAGEQYEDYLAHAHAPASRLRTFQTRSAIRQRAASPWP